MKSASPTLIALLDSGTFLMAELFTITLKSGTVLRYTDADAALTYGGHSFAPFPLSRGTTRLGVGIQVDTMALTLFGGADTTVAGSPLPALAASGGFDGARVLVERAFMATFGDTTPGTVHIFEGRVAQAKPSRTAVELTVNSETELLNIKLPRNVYQTGCRHTLFDAGCTLDKLLWGSPGEVQSGATATVIPSDLGNADGYFTLGTVEFTSGANSGLKRTVKLFAGSAFTLVPALPVAPAAGDTFDAYPGCDKRQQTCNSKFSNKANFGGQPFVPRAEAAV